MARYPTIVTSSAPTASDNACGDPMSTSTAIDTRPMTACGVRRWIRVVVATKRTGIAAPTTTTLPSITASESVRATPRIPTAMVSIPATVAATSPTRRMTTEESRPPTTAPTPWTVTTTPANVAGLPNPSSRE